MRVATLLALLGCLSCVAAERLTRATTLNGGVMTGAEGTVHRLTPGGSVGNAGSFSSDDVYWMGVSLSLGDLLEPRVQPIRLVDPVDSSWTAPEPPPVVVDPDQESTPHGVPPWVVWAVLIGLPAACEALSRLRGGEGVVVPTARKVAEAVRGRPD